MFSVVVPMAGRKPLSYPLADGRSSLSNMQTLTGRGFTPEAHTEAYGINEMLTLNEMQDIFSEDITTASAETNTASTTPQGDDKFTLEELSVLQFPIKAFEVSVSSTCGKNGVTCKIHPVTLTGLRAPNMVDFVAHTGESAYGNIIMFYRTQQAAARHIAGTYNVAVDQVALRNA